MKDYPRTRCLVTYSYPPTAGTMVTAYYNDLSGFQYTESITSSSVMDLIGNEGLIIFSSIIWYTAQQDSILVTGILSRSDMVDILFYSKFLIKTKESFLDELIQLLPGMFMCSFSPQGRSLVLGGRPLSRMWSGEVLQSLSETPVVQRAKVRCLQWLLQ